MATLTKTLLWFCALGCGLMGGLYFAFSVFIMGALDRLGPAAGAAAMNSINTVILRSLFMPVFLLTTLAAAALAAIAFVEWGSPRAPWLLAGGLIYVIGMFGVTMFFNVPLNNELVASGASAWSNYLSAWTLWNHVRTLASLAASALFIVALMR